MNKRRLGKHEYPEENFNEYPDEHMEGEVRVLGDPVPFEGRPHRLVRDRLSRPRLNLKNYKPVIQRCPDCGGALLDAFKGHYGCEDCPYVDWRQELILRYQL